MNNKLSVAAIFIENNCCTSNNITRKARWYSCFIWVLTYCVYASFHLSRKPLSIVKSTLNENCTAIFPDTPSKDHPNWCDWAPFDGDNSQFLLGIIDSCFLFAYAAGMFLCGMIAERMDLRYFLSVGMVFSGIFTIMFGMGHAFKIHVLWFYALSMVLNGLVQATGWPSVVAIMGNWFGKSKRGLIMGVWNSHTSVGNIIGALVASAFVQVNWTYSFVVPGFIILSMGIIVFLFLIPDPSYVSLPNPNLIDNNALPHLHSAVPFAEESTNEEIENLLNEEDSDSSTSYRTEEKNNTDIAVVEEHEFSSSQNEATEHKAISFLGALKIPGVIEFSWCLFFAKLVSYTFLYWLPNYLQHNTKFDSKDSADLSTLFDVGGAIGGIMAGVISDTTHKPATTCSSMLVLAVPMMFLYNTYGTESLGLNILLLMLTGVLVNGPYSLITTAVSAELGTHKSLRGNAHALATVTSIIDGTGSIGAAVGPLLAGPISNLGWDYVFYMLMASDVIALVLLGRLVYHELKSTSCRS